MGERASYMSSVFFGFSFTYLRRHYRRAIETSDIPLLEPEETTALALAEYQASSEELDRMLGSERGLRLKLFWHCASAQTDRSDPADRSMLVQQQLWAVVQSFCDIVPAVLVRKIVELIQARARGEPVPRHEILLYVVLSFLASLVDTVSSGQALILGRAMCIRSRALIVGLITLKILRRRDIAEAAAEGGTTNSSAGRLQTLVSSDMMRCAGMLAIALTVQRLRNELVPPLHLPASHHRPRRDYVALDPSARRQRGRRHRGRRHSHPGPSLAHDRLLQVQHAGDEGERSATADHDRGHQRDPRRQELRLGVSVRAAADVRV